MATSLSPELLDAWHDQRGESLLQLSQATPVLINFLRHAGCPFCKEVLAKLREQRSQIEQAGVQIALIHMMTDTEAHTFFQTYALEDVSRFSDPERKLYSLFELSRGSMLQVLGPAVWWKGFQSTILKRHLPGQPVGDIFQLSGTFVLHKGDIIAAHRSKNSADLADFVELSTKLPNGDTGNN